MTFPPKTRPVKTTKSCRNNAVRKGVLKDETIQIYGRADRRDFKGSRFRHESAGDLSEARDRLVDVLWLAKKVSGPKRVGCKAHAGAGSGKLEASTVSGAAFAG